MITLKHILVATDFSEAADAAFAYGRELARTFGASLDVLHVVENIYARLAVDGFVTSEANLQRELEEHTRNRLNEILCDEDRALLHAKPVILVSEAPAIAIATYARENRVNLIIMGTHGRSGVAHFLMGSVAERVVRIASCPVLTVRHPEHEFVLPDALAAVARG
jgi:nucleotide-binding universal stress UspA family protein